MILAPLALLLAAQPIAIRKPIRPAQPTPVVAPTPSDEQLVKNAHLDATGPGLVEFFRQRSTPSVDRDHLATLVKQLGDKTPAVHTKAITELVGLGPLAMPALRKAALQIDDEETAARARKCLEAIEGSKGANLVSGAVRLLAASNPAGAAEALLNYLPVADDAAVVQEIETALLTVGLREGKPESALVRALTDPLPVRRSVRRTGSVQDRRHARTHGRSPSAQGFKAERPNAGRSRTGRHTRRRGGACTHRTRRRPAAGGSQTGGSLSHRTGRRMVGQDAAGQRRHVRSAPPSAVVRLVAQHGRQGIARRISQPDAQRRGTHARSGYDPQAR